jgi:hypothetical protein
VRAWATHNLNVVPTRELALMTKWQILFDTVNVGWVKNLCFFYSPAAFSIFGAQQVAPAGAPEQHLAGGSYFKTFGYGFSGFITSGTSHTVSFILRTREYLRIQDGLRGNSGALSSRSPAKRLN